MPPHDSSRLRISVVQLIASALAAVTAAIAASYLGVNGTVIGAAVASVLSVAGTAVYSHSLRRTGDRVRSAVPASARWLPDRPPALPLVPPAQAETIPAPGRRVHPLARVAAAAVIVFAAALGTLTAVELVAGRPVSDLVTGRTASGTTVFGSQSQTNSVTPRTPAVTVTVTPDVVVTTPTVTQTAPAVTVTSTPTPTSTAGTSATSTPAGSGTASTSTVP